MSKIITKQNFKAEFIHPELSAGEVFFTNANTKRFDMMKFKSKRKGNRTYDGQGNETHSDDWFPVFLRQSELSEQAVSLSDIRKQFRAECSYGESEN